MIEKLVDDTMRDISGFTWIDQSFILSEVSHKINELSETCLMNEYGLSEEDLQ